MEPWYKAVTPRPEVRAGRSFNPDEFAIALEQVVAGTAPEDYVDPARFFARTCFTRALREHAGMVLRRLDGRTENTAPVLTLITQFGGGKTHTLATLYHLVKHHDRAPGFSGVAALLLDAGLPAVPRAAVGVFVGNAWDPQAGRETPWIELARQLAGDAGVAALGPGARATPPGTEAIGRLIEAAGGSILVLFDEVLNFVNRYRDLAEPFYAFVQNLTVAMTGTTRSAAVISLPRSQVEMTSWDVEWQERLTKIVRRVAKDLIANDEAEIGEVVRRRLFESLGDESTRRQVARAYTDWCFERRAQLPPEWTVVDTATTEATARERLRQRFDVCYPFHPATLSVFQRKWQALPQYQQTRGTLAMLAQWISWAYRDAFQQARREPLITLGSAPLDVREFRGVVLGQLGEPRLLAAIDADIAGPHAHARALDVDTKNALKDIHRRVGTTILFESSGGQSDKVAHLPELRFALGEPSLDTTSIDNAALALESRAFFIRRVGSDGFRINHRATLKKVVSDRRASLDDGEVVKAMKELVRKEFERGAAIPVLPFPEDGDAVPDTPRLTLVVVDPKLEWSGTGEARATIASWTRQRKASDRLYPGALVWCLRKPGQDLRNAVEVWLAWQRVSAEVGAGILGADYDAAERADVQTQVRDAASAAQDEVWAGYRYVVLADRQEQDGLREIDLGAGHASSGGTLCLRIITALKSQALLNESVGAGYIERHWPPALKEAGAWPLSGLRQSFLNGVLTRLVDPDTVLRSRIADFVARGDFGLASGKSNGEYGRVWYSEVVPPEEITFDADVFLLTRAKARELKERSAAVSVATKDGQGDPRPPATVEPVTPPEPDRREADRGEPSLPITPVAPTAALRILGEVPPEVWNRLGTRLIPKLRSAANLTIRVDVSATVDGSAADDLVDDLEQIRRDLGLEGLKIEKR